MQKTVCLLFALICCPLLAEEPSSFSDDYGQFRNHQTHLLSTETQALRKYHFVLVEGYMNELIFHYFSHNKKALADSGISTSILAPPSSMSLTLSLPWLNSQFEDIHSRTKKPLIVIGHSFGGVRALATIIKYPSLISTGVVARLVTVQSSVNGATTLDASNGGSDLFKTIVSLLKFSKVSTAEIQKLILIAFVQLDEEQQNLVSTAVYYFKASVEPENLGLLYRNSAINNQILVGPNDGLVATRDMTVPYFGSTIGSLHGDHTRFVNHREGYAFTLALLRHLFRTLNCKEMIQPPAEP